MLWEIVELITGSVPPWAEFIKIFVLLYIFYFTMNILNIFIVFATSFIRGRR